MDSMSAFARGRASQNNPVRVFDWDQAARRIKETNPTRASAGLGEDWEWTGGEIYANGKPVAQEDTYTYLVSTWAIPELSLDDEIEECWIWEKDSPGWDEHTYWPESAKKILQD